MINLDPWHSAIADRVCAEDAARVARTGHGHVRLAEPQELCQPGQGCATWPTVITVVAIAPGVRMRVPSAGIVVA